MRIPRFPLACALASVSLVAQAAGALAADKPVMLIDPPAISIAVSVKIVSSSRQAAGTVARIVDEANRLWRPYGVRLVDDPASAERRVQIRIVDDPPPGLFGDGEGAGGLGWITFLAPGRPRDLVYLSWKRAVTMLSEVATPRIPVEQMPDKIRGAYLGRALGRTLAHEIGHYLLNSTAHSRKGLMRPSYSAYQLFDASEAGFLLEAADQARLEASTTSAGARGQG